VAVSGLSLADAVWTKRSETEQQEMVQRDFGLSGAIYQSLKNEEWGLARRLCQLGLSRPAAMTSQRITGIEQGLGLCRDVLINLSRPIVH